MMGQRRLSFPTFKLFFISNGLILSQSISYRFKRPTIPYNAINHKTQSLTKIAFRNLFFILFINQITFGAFFISSFIDAFLIIFRKKFLLLGNELVVALL